MADDGSVTDDEIMTGFKSLQEAMALGFERQNAELRSIIDSVVHSVVRSVVQSEIALVRADISALEHRVLRRFDKVDERFKQIDERFNRTDEGLNRIEHHLGLGQA